MENKRTIVFFNALGLCLFALLTMGAVFIFYFSTEEQIQKSRASHQEKVLYDLIEGHISKSQVEFIPMDLNNFHSSTESLNNFRILETINEAGQVNKKQRGFVLIASSKEGYSGDISLLLAINNKGEIIAVRVLEHWETPGLGDKIEKSKSEWINQFKGKTLASTLWKVHKDGGGFESISGATISSRAVIKAVEESLIKWDKGINKLK